MKHFSASAQISWSRTQFQLLSEIYITCFQPIYVYFPLLLREVHGLHEFCGEVTSAVALTEC